MKYAFAVFYVSALLIAGCATSKTRTPAEAPTDAPGLPTGGIGEDGKFIAPGMPVEREWPEGVVGEPAPMDLPCQEAASSAVLKTLEKTRRGCNIWGADAIEMNKEYSVRAQCGKDEVNYKVKVSGDYQKCFARTPVKYNGQ